MLRLLPLTLMVFQGLLAGCAVQSAKDPLLQDTVSANAAMIQAQQDLIGLQNEQLEEMSSNQENLASMLHAVQQQLLSMQQNNQRSEHKTEKVARKAAKPLTQPLDGKMVVGRNEWVWVDLLDQYLDARVDTGTRSSTIKVKNIQPFERNGEAWVRFDLGTENIETFEAPLKRYLRVRNGGGEDLERRPVIQVVLRIGHTTEEAELTLTSKEGQAYSLALGRDFLRDIAVVDVARKYVQPKNEEQTVSR